MGVTAFYRGITEVEFEKVKGGNLYNLGFYEEYAENEELTFDLDKLWEIYHFVLTGCGIADSDERPLSQAVMGELEVPDYDEYVALISKERLEEIVIALREFDMQRALEEFNPRECEDVIELMFDLKSSHEVEEIKSAMEFCYQNMLEHYEYFLEKNYGVLVTLE